MTGRSAPPRWARGLADGCLWFTAACIPLSTTGMQAGVVVLGLLSLASAVTPWNVIRRTPLDAVLALFVGTLACSTLVNGHVLQSIGWLKLWTMAAYFAVYWWLDGVGGARRFLHALAGAGALAALYGIVQHFTGIDWFRELMHRPLRVRPRHDGESRFAVVGFFRNYLTFAHTMVAPYASALALGLGRGGGWGVAAVVIVTAILFSTARGAWVAVVAATFVIVRLGWGRRAGVLAMALASVALIAVLQSPALRNEVGSMFALGGDNVGRVAIYQVNLSIIHDHPITGLGFGRYLKAAAPYYRDAERADRRSHAHNNFLQIAAEAGLQALAAFCLLYAHALRLGLDAIRAPRSRTRLVATAATGAIVGFLAGGLTQYTFGDGEVAIAMWCMLAVLMRARPATAT